jgi:hypothetical protein
LMKRFGNLSVPVFYVFDRKHELRHFQTGGKGLDRVAFALERVLGAREIDISCMRSMSALSHQTVNSDRSDCEDTCWRGLSYDEDQCQLDWDRCTEFAESNAERKACDDAHTSCSQMANQYYYSCLQGCSNLSDD